MVVTKQNFDQQITIVTNISELKASQITKVLLIERHLYERYKKKPTRI